VPVQLEALKSSLEESQRLLASNTQKAEQVSRLCHEQLSEHIKEIVHTLSCSPCCIQYKTAMSRHTDEHRTLIEMLHEYLVG